MADKTVVITHQLSRPIKVLKWKVTVGGSLSIGRVILLYDFEGAASPEQRKLKSTQAGTIRRLVAKEGAVVAKGDVLIELAPCIHPTVMKDMCGECGADLRKEDIATTASVPMVHAIPDLKVSEELAQKLGKADGDRLLKDRKLVLLVDLDQTLIHTTNDNIPPNIKDVYHFQLYGPNSPWYHTRLRPGTHQFLNNISNMYELHICTFGARNYAHMITMFLDGDQRFFSNRILSRDECFDPTSKKANLKALFPCGDNMVCIIDDREDVWSHATNLIHVKPYHFFQHTGDINAPPGLDKQENDEKGGVDLTKIKFTSSQKKLNGTSDEDNKDTAAKVEEVKETRENGRAANGENNVDVKMKENGEEKEKDHVEGEGEGEDEVEAEKEEGEINDKDDEKKEGEVSVGKVEKDKDVPEDLIEIEDCDDYLLYLEDILRKIHQTFYDEYDKLESGQVPDLKQVIPGVRGQILKGCNLVFSGLVPTHLKLRDSKAFQVARSLGANITQDLEEDTTHLVAVRPGTAKVNAGRRRKNIKIVTPDWLWACAERWERVEEVIFPLNSKGSKNRHPPPHCSSPEHVPSYPDAGGGATTTTVAAQRKRTNSGRFIDMIPTLMCFSSDDLADMGKEVDAFMDDDDDDSESENENSKKGVVEESANMGEEEDEVEERESSSSEDSLTGEFPKGFKRSRDEMEEEEEDEREYNPALENEESTTDESPSAKFRRGGRLEDSDLDMEDTNSVGSDEAPDEVDDGDWNMMGAALEREFLSNN